MQAISIKSEINFEIICRTCLQKSTQVNSVFSVIEETQTSIAEMLKTFTKLQIQFGDELPQKICNDCKNLIIAAYNFKNQSEQNEKLLWKYLLDENKNDELLKHTVTIRKEEKFEDICHDSNDSVSNNFEPTLEVYIKEEISDEIEDRKDHIKNVGNIMDIDITLNDETEISKQTIKGKKMKKKDLITKNIKEILLEKTLTKELNDKDQFEINDNGFNNLLTPEELTKQMTSEMMEQAKTSILEIKKEITKRARKTEVKQYDYDDLVCKVCKKAFVKPYLLKKHMVKHDPNNKKFECNICHKLFTQRDNMKTHIKRFHDKSYVPKPVTHDGKQLCTYCGKRVSHITVHLRRHTGEKPFKCDQCDRAFPRLSDVKQHQLSHTGEKPFLCTVCGKGFAKSNKLKCHQRIHTGERPYKCTYCEQAFILAKDLKHHVRRHTGEKPHECGDCGKRFIQKTALRTHCKSQGHNYANCINHEAVREGLLIRPLNPIKIDSPFLHP